MIISRKLSTTERATPNLSEQGGCAMHTSRVDLVDMVHWFKLQPSASLSPSLFKEQPETLPLAHVCILSTTTTTTSVPAIIQSTTLFYYG